MHNNEIDPKEEQKFDKDEFQPDTPQNSWLLINSPLIFLIIAALIITLIFMPLIYSDENVAQISNENHTNTEQSQNDAMIVEKTNEVGTFTIDYYYESTIKASPSYYITYFVNETDTEHIEIQEDNIEFIADGNDNQITLTKVSYNLVEAANPENILEENVQEASYKAKIHYNSGKQNIETYKFVSLEKNGSSDASLTYSEAAGITDTINISPSKIEIEDDGEGIVEKVSEYDDDRQWITRWVIHSLSE